MIEVCGGEASTWPLKLEPMQLACWFRIAHKCLLPTDNSSGVPNDVKVSDECAPQQRTPLPLPSVTQLPSCDAATSKIGVTPKCWKKN